MNANKYETNEIDECPSKESDENYNIPLIRVIKGGKKKHEVRHFKINDKIPSPGPGQYTIESEVIPIL